MILDSRRCHSQAVPAKLQLGGQVGLAVEESEAWRVRVRRVLVLPVWIIPIGQWDSPMLLRRAHLVLAYTLPIHLPSIYLSPYLFLLSAFSEARYFPPLLTFSDTVLCNWVISTDEDLPTLLEVRSSTLFMGLRDEEEFCLCSARIELRGSEALQLVRATIDETSMNDPIDFVYLL